MQDWYGNSKWCPQGPLRRKLGEVGVQTHQNHPTKKPGGALGGVTLGVQTFSLVQGNQVLRWGDQRDQTWGCRGDHLGGRKLKVVAGEASHHVFTSGENALSAFREVVKYMHKLAGVGSYAVKQMSNTTPEVWGGGPNHYQIRGQGKDNKLKKGGQHLVPKDRYTQDKNDGVLFLQAKERGKPVCRGPADVAWW